MADLIKPRNLPFPVSSVLISLGVFAAGVALDSVYNREFIRSLKEYRPFFDFLSFFGLGGVQILLLVFIAGAVSRLKFADADLKWKVRSAAHAGVLAVAAGGLLAQLLKHLFGRPRPRLGDVWGFAGPTFESGFNSFPSGHTFTSFALAAVIVRYFPGIKWFVFPAAFAIAVSRVGGGSHYPSDIAGGIVGGILTGTLLGIWCRRNETKEYEAKKLQSHAENGNMTYFIYCREERFIDILTSLLEIQCRIPSDWKSKKSDGSALAVGLQHPDLVFHQNPGATVIKAKFIDMPVYFKLYHYDGFKQFRPFIFYPSKAVSFKKSALGLSKAGMTVPAIYAYGEAKRYGLLKKSFLLFEEMQGAPISSCVKEYPGRQREFLRSVSAEIEKLHGNGIYHGDLRPANILLSDGGISFIDLEKITISRRNNISLIARDLGKLNDPRLEIRLYGRLRFFVMYCKRNKDLWKKKKTLLKLTERYSLKTYKRWRKLVRFNRAIEVIREE